MNQQKYKIKIFYHLALMNNWKQITNTFLSSVIASGLYEICDSIDFGIVGDHKKFDYKFPSKINLNFLGKLEDFEFPTLQLLWNKSIQEDFFCLYFHSKGVSLDEKRWLANLEILKKQYPQRTNNSYKEFFNSCKNTRYWLNEFLIKNFSNCTNLLQNFDIVCLKHNGSSKFIPSNFWWAKSNHIKKLDCPKFIKDRYDAEMWILRSRASVYSFLGKKHEYKLIKLN